MYSTVGRPRIVTDTQVAAILEWHRSRKSAAELARQLGVSVRTITTVIRRNGQYKQPSPEQRQTVVDAHRRRRSWLLEHALM